jgi:hypothetical protein
MALFTNQPVTPDQAKVMNRYDIIKRMLTHLHRDEAVIGGIGYSNFDLWAASANPNGRRQQNFYMLGGMGLAVPIALGVALAQPQRRTIALEGDGFILMQLGCLGTVAARDQKNLIVVILDNGAYQNTGGQKTLTGQGVDIVARLGRGRKRLRGDDRPRAKGRRAPDHGDWGLPTCYERYTLMTTMVAEVYDAPMAADCPDDKARKAAAGIA